MTPAESSLHLWTAAEEAPHTLNRAALLLHWLTSLCYALVSGSVAWSTEPALALLALDTPWWLGGVLLCSWSVFPPGFIPGSASHVRVRARCEVAPVDRESSLAAEPAMAPGALHRTSLLADRF